MLRALVSALVVFTACLAPAAAQRSDRQRIPTTLPFDAQVSTNVWADATLGYRTFDDSNVTLESDDIYISAALAFELLKNLELGAQFEFIDRDYDNEFFGSESGPSDLLTWGKYNFYRQGETVISAGAIVSLPTGDEDAGFGSDDVEPGAFISGGTRLQGGVFLQGHLGLRNNGDLERSGFPPVDGKTSILIGVGGVMEPNPGFELFAGFDLETERYEEGESFARLGGGGRWTMSDAWRLQAQAGFGLADAAPQFYLAFGVVYAP